MGWATPEAAIGKWLSSGLDARKRMEIVGVVRDYNFESMHHPIAPLVFYLEETGARHVLVRIAGQSVQHTLDSVGNVWDRMSPNQPFVYSFLDEEFDRLYLKEQRWGTMMAHATVIALLIACLGLFGLTAYNTAQRAKEIGIRKVLGSTIGNIVGLISRDVVLLVGVSFVIAAPVAWLATRSWLEGFAFRADPGFGSYLLAGLLTLIVALLSVGHLAIRAAAADPVKSLRYE
jgi:putative ABC transport system permease protein